MPNFLQWLAGNAQFLLFIVVFIVPMLGGLLRWIETQRERRRRQAELERRRLEALRTGRVDAESPASRRPAPAPARAGPTREEIVARRQREMQEKLRQRLEQQRRAGQPGASQTTVRRPDTLGRPTNVAGPRPSRPPTSTGPVIPGPTARTPTRTTGRPTGRPTGRAPTPPPTIPQQPTHGRPFPQQQRSRPQRQPQQARPEREVLPRVRPQQVPVSPSLQSNLGDVAREEIGSAREAASLQGQSPVVRIGPGGLSLQRLREAVVLREVLDQPLALRQPGSDLFT